MTFPRSLRIRILLGAIALTIGMACNLAAQEIAVGADIDGVPRITDGDTLRIGDARIRLHGIDAPETDQHCKDGRRFVPCGTFATDALTTLIGEGPVTCSVVDVDRYARAVATCFSQRGVNLNDAMALEGWAIAMPRYSDAYIPSTAAARDGTRGLWAYEFHAPSDWRKGVRW